MTLKFHTLEHIGVCCLLRRNLAAPRLRSPSNSHSFFSKMNEAGFIFKREFSALGGTIVSEEYPPADQNDMRLQALRITKAGPDAVFFAIFNQVAIAAKALVQYGFRGGKFAAIMDASHVEASAGALDGTELYLFDPPSKGFVERFKARFMSDPGVFADSAYDAVVSLAAAINVAGTLDRQRVIEALHQVKFTGSSGQKVSYDRDGLLEQDIALYAVKAGRLARGGD